MPARASAQEDSADVTLAPYFLIENAETSEDGFPLKETKVSTNINGMIAETYVTQTYANEGKNPINAKYIFPEMCIRDRRKPDAHTGLIQVPAKMKHRFSWKDKWRFPEYKSPGPRHLCNWYHSGRYKVREVWFRPGITT